MSIKESKKNSTELFLEVEKYGEEANVLIKQVEAELNVFLTEKLAPIYEKFPKITIHRIREIDGIWNIGQSLDVWDFE